MCLTGLRGVAALWVLCFHLSFVVGPLFHVNPDFPLIREGYLGVDVFFILSGFILCHVYVSAFQPYLFRQHVHFLLVRLVRIYPLHLLMLVAFALAVWLVPAPPDLGKFPNYTLHGFFISAFLLQNWCRYPLIWNAPAWSLSAEWLAYMILPALLIATRWIRTLWQAIALAALSLAGLASLFILSGHSLNMVGPHGGFLRLAAEFTAGVLMHRANSLGLRRGIPWRWANLLAVLVLMATLLYRPMAPVSVLVLGYVVFSLPMHDGFLQRILSSRCIMFLGEISYSMYLVQGLLLQLATWHIQRHPPANQAEAWRIVAVLITGLLLVPVLTWWAVERPARTFGRRIANRLSGVPGLDAGTSLTTSNEAPYLPTGLLPRRVPVTLQRELGIDNVVALH